VRIWETATWQQRAVLTGQGGPVRAVAIAPSGGWLATGGYRSVRIWDPFTGEAVALMRVEGTIRTGAWLSDEVLACGGRAGLYLFDFLAVTSPRAPNSTRS